MGVRSVFTEHMTNAVYRAVADPTRRRVLERLTAGPLGFQELHSDFDMTKGGFSQHLRVLRLANLIAVDEVDRSRRYRLTPRPLRELAEWVHLYADFWDDKLTALDRVLTQQRPIQPTEGEH
jgi:DNA-binding transcriptional ArsR family regulator